MWAEFVCRLKHYSWRTEQTYRERAWRLDKFVGNAGLDSVTGEDLNSKLGGQFSNETHRVSILKALAHRFVRQR